MIQKKSNKIYELKPFKGDDIHYNTRNIDGYNKTFNFIVSPREPGKTTEKVNKMYTAFLKEGRPSIELKRFQVDITDQYIESIEGVICKFTGVDVKLEYNKSQLKQGLMDIKLNDKLFIRMIALNTPVSRFKSLYCDNVKYIIMDEFICNLRLGEKYLTDEFFRIKELYSTFNRETKKGNIRCYFFGNPYSLFNPYFTSLNVDVNKLKIGTIYSENDYAIELYQLKPELREYILKKNPLYQFDDSYKKYGFEGIAIHDTNVRIEDRPLGFKLEFVFKLHDKTLGVYSGYDMERSLFYYAELIKYQVSNRRDILCFDFSQMSDKAVLVSPDIKKDLGYLVEAIRHRQIAYKSVEESYLMEEIYNNL